MLKFLTGNCFIKLRTLKISIFIYIDKLSIEQALIMLFYKIRLLIYL